MYRVYVDDCLIVHDATTRIELPIILRLATCDLLWHGAEISHTLDDTVSHVLMYTGYVCQFNYYLRYDTVSHVLMYAGYVCQFNYYLRYDSFSYPNVC